MSKPGLAFLQNLWVNNPDRVKQILASREHETDFRRRFLERLLFRESLTGKKLRAAFGEDVNRIVWEESTLQIGGHAASVFKPDPRHIRKTIIECQPKFIMAFGAIAASAVFAELTEMEVREVVFVSGPHPAARTSDVMPRLKQMAEQFRRECGV
jgi:hypothetical protein